jgi:hypothetical protein
MYNIILIFCVLIISYFISKCVVDQFFINNDNNSTYIAIFTIALFITSLYIISIVMKSGPKRAIFLDSVFWLLFIPMIPFYWLYEFITK